MIRIVKPEKPYVPKNGDIDIYGDHHEYLAPLDWDEIKVKNPIPIVGSCSFSLNPWRALFEAGIEEKGILTLKSMSLNFCPCADMNYYAIVPVAILAKDSTVYVKDNMFANMLNDAEWNRQNWIVEYDDPYYDPKCAESHLSAIHRAILGSGYHDGILPLDGSHGLILATIPLDNGDKIIVVAWEWYNKQGENYA